MFSTGVPSLDQLLGGGYPDKSAILVEGPTGMGKEALGYMFIRSGSAPADFCLYATKLDVSEVVRDARARKVELEKEPLWIATEGGQVGCDVNDLASLSFSLKELMRRNRERRIRIVTDVLSTLLMLNPLEPVYKFLSQLITEVKQCKAVILVMIEEKMHTPQVVASMEQLFDGVITLEPDQKGENVLPVIRIMKMHGVAVPVGATATLSQHDEPAEKKKVTALRPEASRLAVLPLSNFSPDPKDGYFAEGMTEELITVLSQVKGLRVIARTSVEHYRGKDARVSQIGKELEVGSVMEGSVRMSGDKLRVTVQLIDASTEEHVWSQNYDRRLEDIFLIQGDIARKVAEALKVRLLSGEDKRLEHRSIGSISAYTRYLRGRSLLGRRKSSELVDAKETFENAIAQDPMYAPAYAGLADAYALLGEYWAMPLEVARHKARELLSKALQLDPDLAEAHASLGVQLMNEYQYVEADVEFRRAIALNPSYAMAHMWYAQCLSALGQLNEELEEYRLAEEFDPLSVIVMANEIFAFLHRGMQTEASARVEKITQLDPGSLLTVNMTAYYHYLKEDPAAGIAVLEAHPELHKEAEIIANFATLYGAMGNKDRAMEWLRKFIALPESTFGRAWYTAIVYAELGQNDDFFLWANRAVDRKEMKFDAYKLFSPYRKMSRDPRWTELLARVNLKP